MSDVIFSCPTTGRRFNSGFQATPAELKLIPASKTLRIRCPLCDKIHECDFAAAGLCDNWKFCRERKDCQRCRLATYRGWNSLSKRLVHPMPHDIESVQ
jgi:hypothetical protein